MPNLNDNYNITNSEKARNVEHYLENTLISYFSGSCSLKPYQQACKMLSKGFDTIDVDGNIFTERDKEP